VVITFRVMTFMTIGDRYNFRGVHLECHHAERGDHEIRLLSVTSKLKTESWCADQLRHASRDVLSGFGRLRTPGDEEPEAHRTPTRA
jgi:hypothetical protein